MFKRSNRFAQLRVASPCAVAWEQMSGDDEVRFCNRCQLRVYNISELTSAQLKDLIKRSEGRLCGRLFRRTDGTVITQDCPVGLRALKQRASRTAAAIFALIGGCSMLVTGQTKKEQKSCRLQTQIVRKEIRPNDEGSIISGIVFDPNGAVVAGAKVILLNVHTKETQEVNSSSEGQFKFIALQPGEYSINIEAMGFNLFKQTRLFLEKQQAIDIGVTLMVSEATVTVGILTENEPLEEQGVKTFKQADLLKLPLP